MDQQHFLLDQKHAVFMNDFIRSMRKEHYRLIGCEIPYNYFGDRGVIDVILRKDDSEKSMSEWLICELKPELVDIGASIRQVRKAQEYFRKARSDMQVHDHRNEYRFVLVLDAALKNLQQIEAFHPLFQDIEILYHSNDLQLQRQTRQIREIEEAITAVQRIV